MVMLFKLRKLTKLSKHVLPSQSPPLNTMVALEFYSSVTLVLTQKKHEYRVKEKAEVTYFTSGFRLKYIHSLLSLRKAFREKFKKSV